VQPCIFAQNLRHVVCFEVGHDDDDDDTADDVDVPGHGSLPWGGICLDVLDVAEATEAGAASSQERSVRAKLTN